MAQLFHNETRYLLSLTLGILLLTWLTSWATLPVQGQSNPNDHIAHTTVHIAKRPAPYHLTPTLLLRPEARNLSNAIAALRSRMGKGRSQQPLGTRTRFFVRDLLNLDRWYTRPAELVFQSDRLSLWIDSTAVVMLTQHGAFAQVRDSLVHRALVAAPPAALVPNDGLLDLLARQFGDIPDVDGDGRLDVLLLDIPDDFARSGAYVAGFFDPVNLTDHPSSNRRDLVYLDLAPTILHDGQIRFDEAAATLTHEAQHLIHARYEEDVPETLFLNEGLSEWAEILAGYAPRPAEAYLHAAPRALLSWSFEDPLPDYARASLFVHYLFEQIGYEHAATLVQSPRTGVAALREVLARAGGPSLETLVRQWGLALLANDVTLGPAYGYRHPQRANIRFASTHTHTALPTAQTLALPRFSHATLAFPFTETLDLDAATAGTDRLHAAALLHYPDGTRHLLPDIDLRALLTATAAPHGSITVLLHNLTPPADAEDSTTTAAHLLATGTPSGQTHTLRYDDGLPDPYSGNASFLLLRQPEEAVALAFGPGEGAWLRAVGVHVLFQSEVGNVAPTEPRTVRLHIARFDAGRPGTPLTPPEHYRIERPFGVLGTATISLAGHYAVLASLPDSFCVVLSGTGAPNAPAIALDRTAAPEAAGPAFYQPGTDAWQPLADVRAAGASLAGFRPILRAEVWQPQTRSAGALALDFAHDLTGTFLRLHALAPLDTLHTQVAVRLPSGAVLQPRPLAPDAPTPWPGGDTHARHYRLPLQADGPYTVHASAVSRTDGNRLTGTASWTLPLAHGYDLGQPYPNPAPAQAWLPLLLVEATDLHLERYDLTGRRLGGTETWTLPPGLHRLPLDLRTAASGAYFLRLHLRRQRDGRSFLETRALIRVR